MVSLTQPQLPVGANDNFHIFTKVYTNRFHCVAPTRRRLDNRGLARTLLVQLPLAINGIYHAFNGLGK